MVYSVFRSSSIIWHLSLSLVLDFVCNPLALLCFMKLVLLKARKSAKEHETEILATIRILVGKFPSQGQVKLILVHYPLGA
jgi:hypothetical protein